MKHQRRASHGSAGQAAESSDSSDSDEVVDVTVNSLALQLAQRGLKRRRSDSSGVGTPASCPEGASPFVPAALSSRTDCPCSRTSAETGQLNLTAESDIDTPAPVRRAVSEEELLSRNTETLKAMRERFSLIGAHASARTPTVKPPTLPAGTAASATPSPPLTPPAQSAPAGAASAPRGRGLNLSSPNTVLVTLRHVTGDSSKFPPTTTPINALVPLAAAFSEVVRAMTQAGRLPPGTVPQAFRLSLDGLPVSPTASLQELDPDLADEAIAGDKPECIIDVHGHPAPPKAPGAALAKKATAAPPPKRGGGRGKPATRQAKAAPAPSPALRRSSRRRVARQIHNA